MTLLSAVATLCLTLRFVLVLLLPLATTCPSATKMHLNNSKEAVDKQNGCNATGASGMYCSQAYPMGTSSSARACLACSSASRSCRSFACQHQSTYLLNC